MPAHRRWPWLPYVGPLLVSVTRAVPVVVLAEVVVAERLVVEQRYVEQA